MARLIGIDYGKKRVGIAVTDPLQMIVSPLTTIKPGQVSDFLQTYLQKEPVEAIVVGKPLDLQGNPSATMHAVEKFVAWLKTHFAHLAIFTFDERFTSKIAHQSRLEGGFKKKARQDKAAIDSISATFILRDFLPIYPLKKDL
ncbi:MAG: Holliday junction resolvase RuvX [Bacteroidota bacterium]